MDWRGKERERSGKDVPVVFAALCLFFKTVKQSTPPRLYHPRNQLENIEQWCFICTKMHALIDDHADRLSVSRNNRTLFKDLMCNIYTESNS